jgi:SAM-dependent methyltransferase
MKNQGGFRLKYKTFGIDEYYKLDGDVYRNPHEEQIIHAIQNCISIQNLDKTLPILDLACGSGEASIALLLMDFKNVSGIDPFTSNAYKYRMGLKVESFTFNDIAAFGVLHDRYYNAIICSYAMHLCKKQLLSLLCIQLSLVSNYLIIISPHKLPLINDDWGWKLISINKSERIHIRIFYSLNCKNEFV